MWASLKTLSTAFFIVSHFSYFVLVKADQCIYVFADMVKNKGFLPSGPSEILIQRNQIKDIVFSLLPACIDPDPESNVPFKVNAIIANPPAYGKTISLMNYNLNYSWFDEVACVVSFTFTLLLIKNVHHHSHLSLVYIKRIGSLTFERLMLSKNILHTFITVCFRKSKHKHRTQYMRFKVSDTLIPLLLVNASAIIWFYLHFTSPYGLNFETRKKSPDGTL